jgi:hypothetical protein
LDAWEEEDTFTNVSPGVRNNRKSLSNSSPTNNKSSTHAFRLKQLKQNSDAIDLDF